MGKLTKTTASGSENHCKKKRPEGRLAKRCKSLASTFVREQILPEDPKTKPKRYGRINQGKASPLYGLLFAQYMAITVERMEKTRQLLSIVSKAEWSSISGSTSNQLREISHLTHERKFRFMAQAGERSISSKPNSPTISRCQRSQRSCHEPRQPYARLNKFEHAHTVHSKQDWTNLAS